VDVVGLEDAPDALVPLEQVSGADLDRFDLGHGVYRWLRKGREFYTIYNHLIVFDAKSFVAGLPNLPGVYRMLGARGEALYVGKART